MYPVHLVALQATSVLVRSPAPRLPAASLPPTPAAVHNAAAPSTRNALVGGVPALEYVQRGSGVVRDEARPGDTHNTPDEPYMPDYESALGRAGRYCIHRTEGNHYLLVHRPRGPGAPPLKRTPLEFTEGKGWQLHVPVEARLAWHALRGEYYPTLDALKAALPHGMQEVPMPRGAKAGTAAIV